MKAEKGLQERQGLKRNEEIKKQKKRGVGEGGPIKIKNA